MYFIWAFIEFLHLTGRRAGLKKGWDMSEVLGWAGHVSIKAATLRQMTEEVELGGSPWGHVLVEVKFQALDFPYLLYASL